jgi:RNA polymerase sigma-70 factor (sigma-E family)
MVDALTLSSVDEGEPFGAFYRRSYARAVRLAVLLGATRSEADDLAQDAFARMCRRWHSVRSPDHYLDAAIRNSCRSLHRRRRKGHGVSEPFDADGRDHAVWDFAADLDLARAVAALPPRFREVLVLRYYQDLSEREIAAVIGRPAGTVKSRLSRALAELTRSVDRG